MKNILQIFACKVSLLLKTCCFWFQSILSLVCTSTLSLTSQLFCSRHKDVNVTNDRPDIWYLISSYYRSWLYPLHMWTLANQPGMSSPRVMVRIKLIDYVHLFETLPFVYYENFCWPENVLALNSVSWLIRISWGTLTLKARPELWEFQINSQWMELARCHCPELVPQMGVKLPGGGVCV